MPLSLKILQAPLAWSAIYRRTMDGLAWAGRFVLLIHYRAAARLVLALGAAAAFYLAWQLFLSAPVAPASEGASVKLDTAAVAKLESWIDERARAGERELPVPAEVLRP